MFITQNMFEIIFSLILHIIYGVSVIKNNREWTIIYLAINAVISAFLLAVIIYCACLRNRARELYSVQQNLTTEELPTYVEYKDGNIYERMSHYSVDTEAEFSYYDQIPKNNIPASEVATMKLLKSK